MDPMPEYQVIQPSTPYTLQAIPGFPYQYWITQKDRYIDLMKWYNGTVLSEKDTVTGVEQYPIKVNPLRTTARRHASVLFGVNLDSINFGGLPLRFVPQPTDTISDEGTLDSKPKEKNSRLAIVRDALTSTWQKNNGGALMYANAILSQWLGGSVLAAKWLPDRGFIEINNPSPMEFYGIPDGVNYWELREAWIVREIQWHQLKAFGVTTQQPQDMNLTMRYWYVEHWTKEEYQITINTVVLKDKDGNDYAGPNPFGFVPMTYIPHMREDTTFLGTGIINETVKGLIREMNVRLADIGDAVSDDAHKFIAMRNVRGSAPTKKIDGRTVVDLGSMTGIGAGEGNPDLFGVNISSASVPMLNLFETLMTLYRREVDHPAVADGVDEGSQRSSLTLNSRMYPLESHAEIERIHWSIGLLKFNEILLKMMAMKGINNIVDTDVEIPLVVEWKPMLPRDREQIINEIAIRDATHTASKRHLMQVAGDIKDPDAEFQRIVEEQKLLQPIENPPMQSNSKGPNTLAKEKSQNQPDGP